MKNKQGFDEVMIVNPGQPGSDTTQRVRLMRFHNVFPPEMGGFAEPEYGYYAEPIEDYGYFAEEPLSEDIAYAEIDPTMAYYGEVDPMGYYSEIDPLGYYGEVDPIGYYGEIDPLGYYGEVDPMGYYGEAEPVGYFAEEVPIGYYGEEAPLAAYGQDPMGYFGEDPMGYYAQVPEMVGYGEPVLQFAEDYPGVSYYGEPEYGEPEMGYGAYVRDVAPAFNAGCPLPTNLSGFEDVDGFDGYSTPATVNPTCNQMTSQPGSTPSLPDTFKPLW